MSEENITETSTEATTLAKRFCPICAGFMYWQDSLTILPEFSGYECEECFYFEFT